MTEKTAKERVTERRPNAYHDLYHEIVDLDCGLNLSGRYATEELAWQAAAAYLGCN